MFTILTGWHWLSLGIGLLLLEVFGVGGILIGVGAGAIAVALIVSVIELTWQVQFVLFGVLALAFTGAFWRFFRVKHSDNETDKLNNRMAQLVGTRASVLIAIKAGRGKIQVQDALWAVSCDKDLPVGAMVEVVGYDESLLSVVPLNI